MFSCYCTAQQGSSDDIINVNHAQRTSLFFETSTELDMPSTVASKEYCSFAYYIVIRHSNLVSNGTKPLGLAWKILMLKLSAVAGNPAADPLLTDTCCHLAQGLC